MIRGVLKYLTQGKWEINCSIKAECGTEWELEEFCSREKHLQSCSWWRTTAHHFDILIIEQCNITVPSIPGVKMNWDGHGMKDGCPPAQP